MRVVLLLFLFLSRVGVAVQMGSSLESMLDIMAGFSTGHEYDRDFLGRLYSCWDSVNPNVKEVQDRIWQGFLNFSRTGGNPDGSDVWAPNLGCKAPEQGGRDVWFEKNLSIIGGPARNMTICEPCNFNSNLAFYRTSVRICNRKWNFSDTYKGGLVRAAASTGTGSAFMHGSETSVGETFDRRGMTILPLMAHQLSITALPEPFRSSTILRDMSLVPGKASGLEMMDLLSNAVTSLPVQDWHKVLEMELHGSLSDSIGPLLASYLSLVLPEALVDEIISVIVRFLGSHVTPEALVFLKNHYIPTYRNATAPLRAKLGPLKKLEIARVGFGAWMKFAYYTLWQEEIIESKFFLKPWVNRLGAELMPAVFHISNALSGFEDDDPEVRNCGPNVYPGAGWCRRDIPHTKSHEIAASAFYDLVSFGEYLGGLYAAMDSGVLEMEEAESSHQATLVLDAVVDGVRALVRAAATHDNIVPWIFAETTALDSAEGDGARFWRLIAAGSMAVSAALLVVVVYLIHLRSQACPGALTSDDVGAHRAAAMQICGGYEKLAG